MNKSEFKKAVADNEAPIPGYLYRDMAQWTFVDFATQLQLIKALFDKLQTKNSAFVLYKALHLVKVLCEMGHESFQKELQLGKYTNTLKDFTAYRGPLDIKYGDSWNVKVRTEAQAALEAIFHTRVSTAPAASSSFPGAGFASLPGSGMAGSLSGGGAMASRGRGDWSGMGSQSTQAASAAAAVTQGPWGRDMDSAMPSFNSPNPYGTNAPGTATAAPGHPPAVSIATTWDTPGGHIGEMPAENRWAAHQREMAIVNISSSGITSQKPSKTLLQQLASTAKSGVQLMTQFEVLKGKQERLYGDKFGQTARALTGPAAGQGFPGQLSAEDDVGGYQPVSASLNSSPPVPASRDGANAGIGLSVPTAPTPTLPSVPVGQATASSPTPPLADLFGASPAKDGDDAIAATAHTPSRVDSNSHEEEPVETLLHAMARARQPPSRVELSRLLHSIEASCSTAEPGALASSNKSRIVAPALAQHLTRDKSWQERLNALACLEAVLRGAVAPVRDSVASAFTQQPQLIQDNYSVVQTSLKEKAGRVAQLLNIPTVGIHSSAPSSTAASQLGTTSRPVGATSSPFGGAESNTSSTTTSMSGFQDLLGGDSAGPSLRPSASAQPVSAVSFEGMRVRMNVAGGARRQSVGSPVFSASTKESQGLGEAVGGRPHRRCAGESAPTLTLDRASNAGSSSNGAAGGSIQVLRSCVPRSNDVLGDLLGPQSASVSAGGAASASTLDDLFGGTNGSRADRPSAHPSRHAPINGALNPSVVTTDDLFAAPLSVSPSPATLPSDSSTAISAAVLGRIRSLMEYLDTNYDPAAMIELEGLIVQRQKQLQVRSSGAAGGTELAGAGMTTTTHGQFQMGHASTAAQQSDRQRANHAFAEAQETMKRQLEL